jgi:hypothetical protein
MARIRKINVSQVEGNNNAVLPEGTIVAYEVNSEYVLRVHDGVTLGGVPFPNAPSIVHNNDINITVDSEDSSSYTWNFGQTGNLTFPDGSVQTTAYTGQTGSSGVTRYVAVNNNGTVYGSADGENWTEYASPMTDIGRVAVGPTNIVYIADNSNGNGESLWYATAYNSTPIEVAPAENVIEYYSEVKYFSSIEKYIAVGYVEEGVNFPILLHSSDGITWTRSYVAEEFITQISFTGNAAFQDIAKNDLGFFITSDSSTLGGFFLENITDALDGTTNVEQEDEFDDVVWVETAASGLRGWHVIDDNDDWHYNSNEDPREGLFDLFAVDDLGPEFEEAIGYQAESSEIVVGDYNGKSTVVIGTSDGQIMYWPAEPAGPFVVVPKPYTATITAWTSAAESVITYTGREAETNNEKFTVTGSSVTAYNGTYYINDNNNKVYTDSAMTVPFDTTGLAAFTGTATITWSHGQYIDALHYSNGIFYMGNDDEEFFISTDGGATWTETDSLTVNQGDEGGYINDIDSYVTNAVTDRLVNGAQTLRLNANGSVTFPDGSIQTTAYTGQIGDQNVWVQTFETVDGAPADVVAGALSVEYDGEGNLICLFSHALDFNIGVSDGGSYFSVAKIATTGTIVWQARFAAGFRTDGWGLAVDNSDSGFVYVAGMVNVNDEVGETKSMLTKLSLIDGEPLWSKVYDFGFNSDSPVVDVATGDPVVVGYADDGSENYITVTKIDSTDGSVFWSRKLDGQGYEYAYGMGVGPNGEVVAVGYMSQLGLTDAAATLYADSNPNWTGGSLGATSNGVAFSVTVTAGVAIFSNISDTIGNRSVDDVIATINGSIFGGVDGVDDMVVKVATLAANDQNDHMLVVKYNSSGAIQWQKAIEFDDGYDCQGADCDIDSNGNIYVTGQYDKTDDIGVALSIIKFNSSGVAQWSRRVTGNCETFGTSIVVGGDNNLYLSGMTAIQNPDFPDSGNPYEDTHSVLAKYSPAGEVLWQRLLENSSTWSFNGTLFGPVGGSNLAVKDGYVALAGSYGDFDSAFISASLAQVNAAGTVFSVGNWDFVAANFSGTLFDNASDITVVNAGKTDSDLSGDITTTDSEATGDATNFLIGTVYRESGGDDRLVNSGNELVLETNGTVTLPQGGTITEAYVTSNPTIQLTPASPDVASQKLVIKGGGSYNYTDNGININYYVNTALVGDTLIFNVSAELYANQTLYWWIYPADAGISDPGTGTIALDETGYAEITFVLDSDDYEFTVRVSPENNNYDPANVGVESGLINADAPTYPSEHHLHLTTGDLTETSIFLGTDDHNVRTTTDGKIQITTPNTVNNIWEFGHDGELTIPGDIRSENAINIEVNLNDSTLRRWQFGEDGILTLPPTGKISSGDYDWTFGVDGTTTLPGAVVKSTVSKTGVNMVDLGKGEAATVTASPSNNTNLTVGTVTGVAFDAGFTLDITVAVNGDISAVVTASDPNLSVGDFGAIDGGGILGGTIGVDGTTFTVATLTNIIVPTAIDLTKSVNKLADGAYTLANGVEGQIMYLVRQTGSSKDNISINVANARIDGILNTTIDYYPFENITDLNMSTLIFTDSAWQASNGGWD